MIRPIIRWGLGCLLFVILSVLLMVAAILFLPSGTRFALGLVDDFVPQVSLQGIEGTLTDSLEIDQIDLTLPGQTLALEQLRFTWQPWSLLDKQLQVDEISLGRVQLDLPAPAGEQPQPESSAGPVLPELPSFELPLQFRLKQLRLEEVAVLQDGSLVTAPVSLSLQAHSEANRVVLDSLEAKQAESRITLSGWTDPSQQFLSQLQGQVSGKIEDWWTPGHWQESKPFQLDLDADFIGAERTASADVSLQQADTRLNLAAQLELADVLQVQYQVDASGIDPSLVHPEWPGQLGLALSGEVSLADTTDLVLDIARLDGQLRNEPISLSGKVSGDLESWQLDAIKLNYAGADAEADGQVSLQTLDLGWRVNAPDLAALLPDAAGSVKLEGQVSGPLTTPSVSARVQVQGVRYANQLSLQQLQGPVEIDLSGQKDWRADLRLQQLEAAGQLVSSLNLKLTGQPEQHQLRLDVDASAGQLELALDGGWQAEQQSWQGQISLLDAKPEPLSHWRSTGSAPLSLSAQDFKLERLCLDEQTEGGGLCVDAAGTFAGQTQANIRLDELALSLLEPFLQGAELTPRLSAQIAFNQSPGGQPELDAELTTTAGKLTPAASEQSLPLEPIHVQARLAEDRLRVEANTELSLVKGELGLNVDVAGLSGAQTLKGQLSLSATDLSLVEVVVPDVQNMQGQLNADFGLSGSLSAPVVNGELAFTDGNVEVPAAGLLLSPLELSVRPVNNGEVLEFSGLFGSGEGNLKLDGSYNLAQKEGLLTLAGDKFEAMNTNVAKVEISPDLNLSLTPQAIRLGGSLTIPHALIATPESRESAVTPNRDVVIVEGGEPLTSEPVVPVYAELDVILGDDVRVDALGFEGRLLGKLKLLESPGKATRASGSIQVESGQYRLYAQDLEIRRGSLVFTGGPVDNPGLDLRIGREVENVIVGANVNGTLREPRMELYGEPAMPDSSVLSYLLLGKAPGESSSSEQEMLTRMALSMSMAGGNRITENLRESLTLDELGFDSNDQEDGSSFFIGKYLSPRLYLRYGIGVMDAVNTLSLKYTLTDTWRVEAQSSELGSGGDILYTFER